MDVQYLVGSNYISYISKYMSKLDDTYENKVLTSNGTFESYKSYVSSRSFGIWYYTYLHIIVIFSFAAYLLMQWCLHKCKFNVVFLDAIPSTDDRRIVNSIEKLIQNYESNDRLDIFTKDKCSKYLLRDLTPENIKMTFPQFWMSHVEKGTKMVLRKQWIVPVRTWALPRFPDQELFFLQQLLFNRPLHTTREVLNVREIVKIIKLLENGSYTLIQIWI